MINPLSKIPLKDLQNGCFVEAAIFDYINEDHISNIEKNWQPVFSRHLSKLKEKHNNYDTDKSVYKAFYQEAGRLMIQDASWNWRTKYKYISQQPFAYSGCAIEYDSKIQGLGYFDLGPSRISKLVTHKQTSILYVEYVATAPWNRCQIERQQYSGVGSAIILHALKLSAEEEMNGRIGLHSLPQSEEFYRDKWKMTDLGYGQGSELRYFEMSEEVAAEWLETLREEKSQ